MKFLIVSTLAIATLCVVVFGAPQGGDPHGVTVTRWFNEQPDPEHYKFIYELSDGQARAEAGATKEIGEEKPIVVSGSYSFIAPDGLRHWVTYTADENGYHPIVGTGDEGGFKPGDDVGIDSNALKSLIG